MNRSRSPRRSGDQHRSKRHHHHHSRASKKHRRSPSRSRERHYYESRHRRSRSPRRYHKRRYSKDSYDSYYDRRDFKREERSRGGGGRQGRAHMLRRNRERGQSQYSNGSQFRFDSPPPQFIAQNATSFPNLSADPSVLENIQQMSQVQQAKADRKLYIGNLPTGITNQQLMENLNQTLVSLKANLQSGGPITSTWISSDGNYAFIEFRTPEEANEGFVLNDLTVLGKPLKVGRPHTYPSNGASGMLSTMANPNLTRLLQPGNWANSADIERHRLMGGRISHDIIKMVMPTPVLQLHNLISDPLEDLEDQDNYQDLLEDVRDECARFGRVKLILIPKLSDYPPLKREYEMRKAMAIDDHNTRQEYLKHAQSEFEKPKKKRKKHHHKVARPEPLNKEPVVPVDGFLRKNADCEITIEPRRKKKDLFLETDLGIGKVFVEFDDEFEAADALSALDGRKFGTNIVTASFFPPQLFKQRRLGPPNHDIENLQKQWEEKLQLMALEQQANKREQEQNNLQAVPLGTNNEILNALFEMPNPANTRATGFMMGGPP